MAVPPPSQPSSTPPSKGGRNEPEENKKAKREFKLPDKEKRDQGPDAGGEGVKELKQSIEQDKKAEIQKKSEITGAQAQAAVKAVGQLITRMVSEMRVGENFANMTLAKGDVPEAFQGSNLTVSYQANALVIHFDNFMTPQQENNAITLVEKNKEQLLDMVQTLQSKNIQVHELSIGTHTVTLPRVEPLPPPFQPTQPGSAETRQEREQDQGGGEEGAGNE